MAARVHRDRRAIVDAVDHELDASGRDRAGAAGIGDRGREGYQLAVDGRAGRGGEDGAGAGPSDVDRHGRVHGGVVGRVAGGKGDGLALAVDRPEDRAGGAGVGEAGHGHGAAADGHGGAAAELTVGQGRAVGQVDGLHAHRGRGLAAGDVDRHGGGGGGVVGRVAGGEGDRLALIIARPEHRAGGAGVGEGAGHGHGIPADDPGGGAAELAVGQGGAQGEIDRIDADGGRGPGDVDGRGSADCRVVVGVRGSEGDRLAPSVAGPEHCAGGAGVSESAGHGRGLPPAVQVAAPASWPLARAVP